MVLGDAFAPGVAWIIALFLVPFYAIVATGAGGIDPIFGTARPEWNPLYWQPDNFLWVLGIRTGSWARCSSARSGTWSRPSPRCVVAGLSGRVLHVSPAGRRRNVFLVLMVLPFWVSYLMRILAWVNLLQNDGLVNRILELTGFLPPQEWLSGRATTVVLGLVYGYIPFFVLPLYASLERIDKDLVKSALDLGASPPSAFLRVTLPLSKQGILAGSSSSCCPCSGTSSPLISSARRGTR